MRVILSISVLVLCCYVQRIESVNIGGTRQNIVHNSDGGYGNILIAIDENVPEDTSLLDTIQEMMWQASEFLQISTNQQKYFSDYTILVPATWSHDPTWNRTAGESFERARVLVAPPNGDWGDRPYTKQPGLCGTEGDYIHLTPGYLQDAENLIRHKTFVHEWAHLRWGLFDEYDIDDQDRAWYTYRRRLYPTRCTRHIDGVIKDLTVETGACSFDPNTGLPTDTCQFIPDVDTTAKASIMFAEFLDSVSTFCSTGEADLGQILHDSVSPNRQNRLCEGLSAWEVMNGITGDFDVSTEDLERLTVKPNVNIIHDYDPVVLLTTTTTTTTPTTTLTTTTPTTTTSTTTTAAPNPITTPTTAAATTPTTIGDGEPTAAPTTTTLATTTGGEEEEPVERNPDVVCLVLDVSGSMSRESRIDIMGSAVANYLRNYLEEGSAVGIISFSSSANILADMTTIINDTTRDYLVDRVPTTTGGGTSIGAGLLKCGEVLQNYAGENTPSTRIFVLSDGEETVSPTVADSLPTILGLGCAVDTIAYSQNADPILTDIATQTGGSSFYFSGVQTSTGMQDALLATIERRRNKDSPITLVSEGLTVDAGGTYSRTVSLDLSIGRDTRLVFTYYNDLEVNVTVQSGNDLKITRDVAFKLITVQVSGIVTGDVTFILINPNAGDPENVVISVTSRSDVPGQDPITASARMDATVVTFAAQSRINMYADVYRGLTPVSGVNVSGLLETADGSDLVIPLSDNGAGADSTAGDGVYSGTLLSNQMTGNGFYSLKVAVDGVGTLSAGFFSGAPKRSSCVACKKTDAVSTGTVNRVSSGGTFQVTNFDPNVALQDNFAPDRVRDLTLTSAIYGEDYVTISWTAPGDDLSYGTVSGYEISVWYDTHVNQSAADEVFLPQSSMQSSMSELLVEAGTPLSLNITLATLNYTFFGLNETDEIDTYFFRLRAYDEENNKGTWSNELSASFVNPADYSAQVVFTTQATTTRNNNAMVAAIAAGVGICVVVLVVAISVSVVVCYKKKNASKVDPESKGLTTSRTVLTAPSVTTTVIQ